ncbi:hypothetical protein SAMN05421825_2217 [Epilithonimonas hungarica]|uniref:Uncharacterized protein n=1 Tax=Epilithonimonas hungarica TaxID=454006 RepID=A0A1G7P9V4_9FLAO|nr:hypothetical protein [Epilithonimonas hungarica]SDF82379.1 hypothetical protein SAMN05421825_2217 [Epilithonimonas hungarica]
MSNYFILKIDKNYVPMWLIITRSQKLYNEGYRYKKLEKKRTF